MHRRPVNPRFATVLRTNGDDRRSVRAEAPCLRDAAGTATGAR
ncbi:MAG: hypothetical protein RIS86_733 [Planctomycetota bacterium]